MASGQERPRIFRRAPVQQLIYDAPCWLVVVAYDCRDYVPNMALLEPSRLMEMFEQRALNPSTCLAGMLDTTRPMLLNMSHVPAAFFRSLEYLLEQRDMGAVYRPVGPEDLAAGAPDPLWCLPLNRQLQPQAPPLTQLVPRQYATLHALATAALSPASYWCLVHKYGQSEAKCEFNWVARDLINGLVNRSVSPFTLVLGLAMRKERNMPWMRSCLFLPLAAVLHQHQAGIDYVPVDQEALQLSTLGFKAALAAQPAGSTGPLLAPGAAGGVRTSAGGPGRSRSDPQSAVRWPPAPLTPSHPDVVEGSALTWPGRGAAAPAAAAPLTAPLSQVQGRQTVLQQPHLLHNTGVHNAPLGVGLIGFDMEAQSGPSVLQAGGQVWATPLLRLLTTNTPGLPSLAPPPSSWWLLGSDLQVQGPFTAEQVLIGYCRGMVPDSALACSTALQHGGVYVPPALTLFQPLQLLMAQAMATVVPRLG